MVELLEKSKQLEQRNEEEKTRAGDFEKYVNEESLE